MDKKRHMIETMMFDKVYDQVFAVGVPNRFNKVQLGLAYYCPDHFYKWNKPGGDTDVDQKPD